MAGGNKMCVLGFISLWLNFSRGSYVSLPLLQACSAFTDYGIIQFVCSGEGSPATVE